MRVNTKAQRLIDFYFCQRNYLLKLIPNYPHLYLPKLKKGAEDGALPIKFCNCLVYAINVAKLSPSIKA